MAIEKTIDKKVKNEHEAQDVPQADSKEEQKIDISQVLEFVYKGYGPDMNDQAKKAAKDIIKKYLNQVIKEHVCFSKYNILILYDTTTMVKSDADNIYSAITSFKDKKPLLLILYSNGGVIGSAYLIGKLCREYSNANFIVTVPRQAKSAATLVCCAADEVHMGSLSELGPIDPQIDQMPALGLKNAIEHIAQLVKVTPESSGMFAKYLHSSLKLIDLGYYERVAESAEQYAIRLLKTHENKLSKEPEKIAHTLVYTYKDHDFVIDKAEAEGIFGEDVIKTCTPEYDLGNTLYKTLNTIEDFARITAHRFYFIGSIESEPNFIKKT